MACKHEKILYVWFYTQTKNSPTDVCSGAIINILMTKIDPPFCHVELQFDDGMAISVTKNHKVCMRYRTFDPMYYTCVKIPVSLEVCIHAKSEANSYLNQSFGYIGSQTTFCSKLVCAILKTSMAVDGLGDPNFTSPSKLYRQLILKKTRGFLIQPEHFPIAFKSEILNLLDV